MALPSLVKTYQYNVNQQVLATGTVLTTNRTAMLLIKNTLKGFGTLPWLCHYSCSSTVAGADGDGVDRWAAVGDLVWATGAVAHSWMVLRRSDGVEMLLALRNTSAQGTSISISISPSATYTGGSTTVDPTATDEVSLCSAAASGLPTADTNLRIHVWHSTDAKVTHIAICSAGNVSGFWSISSPQNPVSGWTNPVWGLVVGTSAAATSVMTSANLNTNANAKGRVSATMSLFFTSEGRNNAMIHEALLAANDLSAEWELYPIGLYSDTASHRGRHAITFDMWFGSDAVATADTYPNDATRTFIQLGQLVLPWNGSVPVMS